MIKLLRVDHRLLHGQVAFSWTSTLSADCILIASDTVMKDAPDSRESPQCPAGPPDRCPSWRPARCRPAPRSQ